MVGPAPLALAGRLGASLCRSGGQCPAARVPRSVNPPDPVRVTALETIRLAEYPNLLWVEIETDEEIVGLGETFFGAQAVTAYLHESVAPTLLGGDPTRIEHWSRKLAGYLGRGSSAAETRGNSAVDIALWDILGQLSGQPLYVLLGGRTREEIRTYNTCAGPRYIRERPEQSSVNWGIDTDDTPEPYDDLRGFLTDAGELAADLLSEGITAMKIWPFDLAAEATEGAFITSAQLSAALEPIEKIRQRVGYEIDVMIELHSLWSVPAARTIARALADYSPLWLEDPVPMGNVEAVAAVAGASAVSVAGGETLASRRLFRQLLERQALGVLILDVSWVGGLTEALKVSALADSFGVPVAPHDCTGPVVLAASTHLSASLPNAIMQEAVRASYRGWYRELVSDLPPISGGTVRPLEAPGLGVRLHPGLRERADAQVTSSRLEHGEPVTRPPHAGGAARR